MSLYRRCAAIRDKDGRQCLLIQGHDKAAPHCTVGKGWEYWGGECKRCGKSIEEVGHECEARK